MNRSDNKRDGSASGDEPLFNASMSYEDALRAFYRAIDGKSDFEIQQIHNEFCKIIPEITARELDGMPYLS